MAPLYQKKASTGKGTKVIHNVLITVEITSHSIVLPCITCFISILRKKKMLTTSVNKRNGVEIE